MSTVIPVRVPDDLAEAMKEQADLEGAPLSSWVRDVIKDRLLQEAAKPLDAQPAAPQKVKGWEARWGPDRDLTKGRASVLAPIPCRCGGLIYQMGKVKGQCSECGDPHPA